jgi:hypothetical protein
MARAKKDQEEVLEAEAVKKPGRKKKVVEAPAEVVEAPVAPQEPEIACGFTVTMTVDGDIAFRPFGSNPNLVTLDGLLKYAERYLEREWAPRLQGPTQQ